jgi:hypothetical protein
MTKQITIGTRTETIRLPLVLRCWQIASLAQTSPHHGAIAALALCSRVGRALKLDAGSYRGDLVRLAEDVAERLGEVGLTYPQALTAGIECVQFVSASLIGEAEVAEAEGNSERPAEDSG